MLLYWELCYKIEFHFIRYPGLEIEKKMILLQFCDKQCSPYEVVTGKIYHLKQQQATVLTACNLLMVY